MLAKTSGNTRLAQRPIARLLAGIALAIGGSAALAQDFVYVVRAGDNPWNITQRYLKNIDYWPRIQGHANEHQQGRQPPAPGQKKPLKNRGYRLQPGYLS